jgi:signal transduction histidine kinase
MKGKFSLKKIVALYFVFVFVPICVLSFFAFRSALREESFLEKQFQDSVLTEIGQTSALVEKDLKDTAEELELLLSRIFADGQIDALEKAELVSNRLIDVSFAVDSRFKVLYPAGQNSLREDTFLGANSEFIRNQQKIPFFQNVAKLYAADILEDKEMVIADDDKEYLSDSVTARVPLEYSLDEAEAVDEEQDQLYEQQAITKSEEIATNMAVQKFQKDPELKKQIVEKAKSTGLEFNNRNVQNTMELRQNSNFSKEYNLNAANDLLQDSLIVSQDKFFSEIIEDKDYGFIPRFVNDKLNVLFWCRSRDNVSGALLNRYYLKERVLSYFPEFKNDNRIVTLIDEFGYPYDFDSLKKDEIDWSLPIVSRELSEIVPGWQIAAYYPDAAGFSRQIRSRTLMISLGIAALIISAIAGAVLIIYMTGYQLRLASKKTSFVANVSHELKTPLTTIRLYTEMIKDGRVAEESRRKYLETILNESQRLSSLINNVLDFSKLEKGSRELSLQVTDLNGLCCEVYQTLESGFKESGFEFELQMPEELLFARVDHDALKQVLINLLSNAVKYSDSEKSALIELYKNKDGVIIDVADRGIGIPDKYREKIFSEFFRVDDSLTAKTGGTGLGLAISRALVHSLGGSLTCHKRKGGGTIFRIVLAEAE